MRSNPSNRFTAYSGTRTESLSSSARISICERGEELAYIVATPPEGACDGVSDGTRDACDAPFEDVDVMDNGGVDGRVEIITSSVSSLNGSKRDEGVDNCDKDKFPSALEGPIFLTSEEGLDGPLATRGLLERLGGTDGSAPIDIGRAFCVVNLRAALVDGRSRRGEMSLMVIRREKV